MQLIMPGAGKASVRNTDVQRAWVSRPSQNALTKGSQKKKVTQPGSNEYQYAGNTPPVIGASNQWIKTILDPAHARSYGCVGAPDNNKLPTVVTTGKATLTISQNTFPVASTGRPVYYMKDSGEILSATSNTEVATRDNTKVDQLSVYTHPYFGHVVVAHIGGGGVTISSGTYTYWIMFVSANPRIENSRCLSMAHVMDNVGDWGNMGGYFTGAHLPVEQNSDADNDFDFLLDASDQESYTTYTGGSAAGIYNMTRIRNLDQAMFFVPNADAGLMYITPSGTTSITRTGMSPNDGFLQVPFGAWDIASSTYYATSTSFTIRITLYSNFEKTLSYSEGGSDGARYDRAAIEFVMGMFDQHDFIYPADHNDSRKLSKTLKRVLVKYRKPLLAAMGVAGAPAWLRAATKGIITGLEVGN